MRSFHLSSIVLMALLTLITSCSDEDDDVPVFQADVFGYEYFASPTNWDLQVGTFRCDPSYWSCYAYQIHPTTKTVSLGYVILIKKTLLGDTNTPIDLSYSDCEYRIFSFRGTDDRDMTLSTMDWYVSGQISKIENGKISGSFRANTGESVDGPVKFELRNLELNVEEMGKSCFYINLDRMCK